MKRFYVDACIYLNLWQKEESKTKKFWKIAEDFFEKNQDAVFYYSYYLLRELKFVLQKNEFDSKAIKFFSSSNFIFINLTREEFEKAREIEKELNFEISFFDIIHMLLAKKSGSILITRDKLLLTSAKRYHVNTKRPEDFL